MSPKHSKFNEKVLIVALVIASFSLFFILPKPSNWVPFGGVIGFFIMQFAMAMWLPGPIEKGLPLREGKDIGKSLSYKLNGLAAYGITILGLVLIGFKTHWASLVYDLYWEFMWVANLFSWILWIGVFIKGRMSSERLFDDGLWREFYLGAERNPRVFGVDLKLFFDGRPSLLAWVIVALSIAFKQYETMSKVSWPMVLFVLFSFLYMLDFFERERDFLSGFEIIEERFGWQLVWGNVTFMPFICPLPAYVMCMDYHEISAAWASLIIILFFLGFSLEMVANQQKDCFKRNPNQKFLGQTQQYFTTENGNKLLISGLWGLCRHPNYFFECLCSLAFTLMVPNDLSSWNGIAKCFAGHLYTIFIWILLITRYERDERKMRKKYGAAFEEYCLLVPWKIFPYLY